MTYRGKVKNGIVVLDKPDALPDGAVVSVRRLKVRRASQRDKKPPTVYDRYSRSIGVVKGMPADFSINHDHYLYGTPKRK